MRPGVRPAVGALALAGAAYVGARAISRWRRDTDGYDLPTELPEVGSAEFFRAVEAVLGMQPVEGNRIELLVNGDQIFPAMLDAIEGARTSVCLLSYVYWTGDIAREVAAAIAARARAGVACHVLLDGVGAAKMDDAVAESMRDAGADVRFFRAPSMLEADRLNNRTHRKILTVDGRIGFTGGVGIAEEWTGDARTADEWRDTHVRVEGPIVRALQGAFNDNWLEATRGMLVGARYLPELTAAGDVSMLLVRSSAGIGDSDMEALFLLLIAAARSSIDIATAYFAPRRAFVRELMRCAERGARVRIIVPGQHADKELVRLAGRSVYGQLVGAGVEIYEYGPTMLHAKTLTIDGTLSVVGSANFDNRSFALNDEASLCVFDRAFAGALRQTFERDLARSHRVTADECRSDGLLARARVAAVRPLKPQL